MLGSRGPVLRAGTRQLSRLLSGQRGVVESGTTTQRCGLTTTAYTTSSNTPPHGPPLPHHNTTPTTMPGQHTSYPTLEKLGLLTPEHIRIKDPAKVEELISGIVRGGFPGLQLVVDFDDTLTRFHMGGQRCHCSWGIMDTHPNMPKYYREEAGRLLAKYYPIEVDPKMTEDEKIPFMVEWYQKIIELLVRCSISQESIKDMVSASTSRLRDGAEDLCKILHGAGVPVLVLSAGMGDVLEQVLRHYNVYTDNMKVVSNFFDYNDEGKMIGFKGKVIHVFNKNEDAIHSSDYFEKLQHRSNVILMGDSLGDIKMAMGVPQPSSVLKIGFLNDKIEERVDKFMDSFDIVLLDDQTMNVANSIVGLMK